MATTYEQSVADYFENSDYDQGQGGSVAKAEAFVKACRDLLIQLPAETEVQGPGDRERVRLNPDLVAQQMKAAQQWLSVARQNATVRHFDFGGFRY